MIFSKKEINFLKNPEPNDTCSKRKQFEGRESYLSIFPTSKYRYTHKFAQMLGLSLVHTVKLPNLEH